MTAWWFVRFFGSQAKFARVMGVTPPSVNRYVKAGGNLPPSWVGLLFLNKEEGRPALLQYEAEHKKKPAKPTKEAA